MKKLFVAAALILVGVMAWRVIHHLSSDAISMALGMFLGVIAGIPTALLLLSSNRHSERPSKRERDAFRHSPQHMMPYATGYPQQPPVIIVTGAQGALPSPSQAAHTQAASFPVGQEAGWPAPHAQYSHPSGRAFRIIGEPDHWDET